MGLGMPYARWSMAAVVILLVVPVWRAASRRLRRQKSVAIPAPPIKQKTEEVLETPKPSAPRPFERRLRLSKDSDTSVDSVMSTTPHLGRFSNASPVTPRRSGIKRISSRLRTEADRRLDELAAFCPAISLWEISQLGYREQLQPSAFDIDAALIFVDISGFTNLCTRLDIEVLQSHINKYFTRLVDVITRHGGDVIRYAGDALLCAWPIVLNSPQEVLASAVMEACRCALELTSTLGSYPVPEACTTLAVHSGIGVGRVTVFRIGTRDRWEVFIAGQPLQQVALAEGMSKLGETVLSAEAWGLVKGMCVTEHKDKGCALLVSTAGNEASHDSAPFFVTPLLELQRQGSVHRKFTTAHEAPLSALVHETARRAIEAGVLSSVPERRSVLVVFCLIEGLEGALAKGCAGLDAVEACLATILGHIGKLGGLLRQFILDDKGMVAIWTFGLPQNSFEDNAYRALRTCIEVERGLSALHLHSRMGLTSGIAFCGMVGAKTRCEYGVMGPSVNLAARLMSACEKYDAKILCNDDLYEDCQHLGVQFDVEFIRHPPIRVKGYDLPVTLYQPVPNTRKSVVNEVLRTMEFFSCLSPVEQEELRNAMEEQQFSKGDCIVRQGDEGETFYIIIDGTVEVSKEDPITLKSEHICFFSNGDYFGELSLLNSGPRSATVKAFSDVVFTVSLGRAAFTQLLGPLQDILCRQSYSDGTRVPVVVVSHSETLGSLSRVQEVQFLIKHVQYSQLTSQPSLVLISGEPGIGKSHTLSELRRCLVRDVLVRGTYSCSQLETEPLAAWLPLLRSLIDSDDGVEASFREVPSPMQELGAVIGTSVSFDMLSADAMHPQLDTSRIADFICSLIREPLAILFDGVENWSSHAWQVLDAVMSKRPSVAFVLAGRDLKTWCGQGQLEAYENLVHNLSRPVSFETCRLSPRVAYTFLELRPLTCKMAEKILACQLGDSVARSSELSEQVYRRCGGNPGFLLALLSQLPRATSSGQVDDQTLIESIRRLPSTVHEVVLAQLDRLPPEQQIIIKQASALGPCVDKEVLSGIYAGARAEVETLLRSHGVQQYLMLDESAEPVGHRFVFRNSAFCEIIYNLMLFPQRQRLHALIADWYRRVYTLHPTDEGIALLCHHAQLSGDSDLAQWSLFLGGYVSLNRGTYSEAAQRFESCIACFEKKSSQLNALEPKYVQSKIELVTLWTQHDVPRPEDVSPVQVMRGLLADLEGATDLMPRSVSAPMRLHDQDTEPPYTANQAKKSSSKEIRPPPGRIATPIIINEMKAKVRRTLALAMLSEPDCAEPMEVIEKHLRTAMTFFRRVHDDNNASKTLVGLGMYFLKRARILLRDATTTSEQDRMLARTQVDQMYDFALESLKQAEVVEPLSAEVYDSLTAFYMERESSHFDPEQALAYAERAIMMHTIRHGAFHTRVEKPLCIRARAHHALREYAQELSVFNHIKLVQARPRDPGLETRNRVLADADLEVRVALPWRRGRRLWDRLKENGSFSQGSNTGSGGSFKKSLSRSEQTIDESNSFSEESFRSILLARFPEINSCMIGLTIEDDGLLSNCAADVRARLMSSMVYAMKLSPHAALSDEDGGDVSPREKAGLTSDDDEMVALAADCVSTPAELNIQLIALLCLALARFSLILADADIAVVDILANKARAILQSTSLYLPSIRRLSSRDRTQVASLLSFNLDIDMLSRGEAVVGTLAPLRATATNGGEGAAKALLFHCVLHAYGKRSLGHSPQTIGSVKRHYNLIIAELRELTHPGMLVSVESKALSKYYATAHSAMNGSEDANAVSRLLFMLGHDNTMESKLASAHRLVPPAEWRSLRKELDLGLLVRAAEKRIELLGVSDMMRACVDTAGAEPKEVEKAIARGLRALHKIYETARATSGTGMQGGRNMQSSSTSGKQTVDCVNAARLVRIGGASALSMTTFSLWESPKLSKSYVLCEERRHDASMVWTGYSQGTVERLTELVNASESSDDAREQDEEPLPLVVITDPGKDNDDELALILCRTMRDMKLIDLRAVVANLAPAFERARLARGTLDELGMANVPAAAGGDGNAKGDMYGISRNLSHTSNGSLRRDPEEDGHALLLRVYEEAEPHSLTLLLISSLVDAAEFIESHEELFALKTARVTIMGGVAESSLQEGSDYIEPDRSAANHRFDFNATELVYRRCQELGVALVVLTRSAAYATSVPAFIYDELASLGHPVALRLRENQREAIEVLFKRACLPPSDPGRLGLPERCGIEWFSQTFCTGTDLSSVSSGRSVWPYVTSLVMYDALALLAAHPKTLDAFFEVALKEVNDVTHCVVGLNDEHPGIRDTNLLRTFLMDGLRYALSVSQRESRTANNSPADCSIITPEVKLSRITTSQIT